MVVDESHVLAATSRPLDSQQTEAAAELAARVPHLLLLSGTPSLTRPFAIWRQVEMLRPVTYGHRGSTPHAASNSPRIRSRQRHARPLACVQGLLGADKWAFGREYCTRVRTPTGWVAPLGAGSRDWELHLLLRRTLMVRRLKAHVLHELPPKLRRWLQLPLLAGGAEGEQHGAGEAHAVGGGADGPKDAEAAPIPPDISQAAASAAATTEVAAAATGVESSALGGSTSHQVQYELAGLTKLPAVCSFVSGLIERVPTGVTSESVPDATPARLTSHVDAEADPVGGDEGVADGVPCLSGGKLVIFAHHRRVLDGLQAHLHRRGHLLVRIDGSTPLAQRHAAIRRFNREASVQLALISVTAAALGIDLSAASQCVFAELPPDAMWLAQAEDRLHRKGQAAAVNVTILLAAQAEATRCGEADDAGADLPMSQAARWRAASLFDRRHARAIKQSERAVRRVTDGPGRLLPAEAPLDRAQSAVVDSSSTLDGGGHTAHAVSEGQGLDAPHAAVDRTPRGPARRSARLHALRADKVAMHAPTGGAVDLSMSAAAPPAPVVSTATDTTWLHDAPPGRLLFECSNATGRVHAYLASEPPDPDATMGAVGSSGWPVRRHASAGAAAGGEDEGSVWWLAHTSFPPDELPPVPASTDARIGGAIACPGTTAVELAAATFLAHWQAISASERRKLRGRPMRLAELPPPKPTTGAVVPLTHPMGDGAEAWCEGALASAASAVPSPEPALSVGSTRRERPRLEAETGAPPDTLWGVARLSGRQARVMPLAVSGSNGAVLCLACFTPLQQAPAVSRAPSEPGVDAGFEAGVGAQVDGGGGGGTGGATSSAWAPAAAPQSDAELFCSGMCRGVYMGRRRGASLRQQLAALDGTRCEGCGLDTAALCLSLAEAPPGSPREAILQSLAPAIAARAGLAARLLEAPHRTGRCWHADHRVAVRDGGGECTVANMQVLCVACHTDKSRAEGRARRASSPTKVPRPQ